ncbi:MAG: 4'-phosphopantetheinyl transferase superfamily protein [Prevotella sp.]|nr:4'-phosphopantetheinyl transferase superfamily protein [Prevotella sp.]MBQ8629275.1 4'-phosphopantetheinyl transferase superfamily protein [Prevotella sp.]
MALKEIRQIDSCTRLGLWEISESVEQFLELKVLSVYKNKVYADLGSESRRLEFLAVRALLYHMVGDDVAILYDNKGCPFLSNGWNISISHTKGFAVIIVSEANNVAVDIEYISERVRRVKSKFIRQDETADKLEELLVCWCAKETLYKFFSKDDLDFCDIRISYSNIERYSHGELIAENLKRKVSSTIYYEINGLYALTYTSSL